MDTYPPPVLERVTLAFCVDGLQAREELLVKAFIRLLSHLTHQKWHYQPPGETAAIDVLFAAPGTTQAFLERHGKLPPAVLTLGYGGENGRGHLSWPLRANALEKELNRLGGLVITQRSPVHDADAVPLLSGAYTGQTDASDVLVKQMRLKQWPPARFLAAPGRMRLATLLTGKAMALDELAYRSNLPRRSCEAFVDELQQAQLLFYPTQSRPILVGGLHTAGIQHVASSYSQVNATIHDSNTWSLKSPDGNATPEPKAKSAPISLLARIRMRLGIGSPSS